MGVSPFVEIFRLHVRIPPASLRSRSNVDLDQMSGFGVAGPLSSKLTQLTCGYQGQAANERRKTSAGASRTRTRTRSYFSLPAKHFPAFLLPDLSLVRFVAIFVPPFS